MYIVTKTTAYGVTAEDPVTEILLVTDEKHKAESVIRSHVKNCGYDADTDKTSARWVDEDRDLVVVVEMHKFTKEADNE